MTIPCELNFPECPHHLIHVEVAGVHECLSELWHRLADVAEMDLEDLLLGPVVADVLLDR